MRITIVGAGVVGTDIATSLSNDHEVTVVDEKPEVVENVTYNVDALAVEGDGASVDTLEEAGVPDSDMVIATTDSDETNVVVCGTVKAMSDAFTVARVAHRKYLRTWERKPGAFGVDLMVAADVLTAEKIVRVVGTPGARDVDVFSEGTVQMAEFAVDEGSPVAGQTVSEADRFDSLTFAAVLRNGDVVIPDGSTRIEASDRVVVIGSPESLHGFATEVAPDESAGEDDEVVVLGGSKVGYEVASILEERGFRTVVVEQDEERARLLAEELPGARVMESDATDRDFLERERIGDADAVVATLDNDEKNLLCALIADRMGVDRTVAVVENDEYVDLFETVGVDVGINPREVVAEEITRLTQRRRTEEFALVGNEQAQVMEIEVGSDSVFVGRTIRDADGELPDGVVVGAVSRDMNLVPARGDTEIQVGDHVVVFVDSEVRDEVVERI